MSSESKETNSQHVTSQPSLKQRKLPFPIHGSTIECHGDDGIEVTGDVAPPLHVSTTFISDAPESYGQEYIRIDIITRRRVEAVIGAIEGGQAVTYSSGQSAATALIHCIKPRRIYLNASYRGVQLAFKLWIERQNIEDQKVQLLTLEQSKEMYDSEKKELLIDSPSWRPAGIKEKRALDLIWLECPNNPHITLVDIE